jgi:hypothetical protein
MLTRHRIEMKYGLLTLALLAGLVALDRTQVFSGLNAVMDDLFALMADLGMVGFFVVAVIGNSALLLQIPYTVPLLSLALGGASLDRMLLMGAASGLGAAVGEIASYAVSLKLLGEKPALEGSGLLRWVKRMVNAHPRLIPPLVFVYAVSPLPDDTVIIPLAMINYGLKRMLTPLFTGKIAHNLMISTVFYCFTSWSADRVSATVQADLALGLLIVFVMIIVCQVEKSKGIKRELAAC